MTGTIQTVFMLSPTEASHPGRRGQGLRGEQAQAPVIRGRER